MNRSRRFWWLVYGCSTIVVLLALAIVSRTALKVERNEAKAVADVQHFQLLNLAAYRLEGVLLPLLAREARRAPHEFLPYYAMENTYSSTLQQFAPNEVYVPSPLMTRRSKFVRMHFQIDPMGVFSSPQAPTGNSRDLAESVCLPATTVHTNQLNLSDLQGWFDADAVRQEVTQGEQAESKILEEILVSDPLPPAFATNQQDFDQGLANQKEWQARQKSAYLAKNVSLGDIPPVQSLTVLPEQTGQTATQAEPGSYVPLWLGEGGNELFFFRRVEMNNGEYLQGIHFDWPKLKEALTQELAMMVTGASLEPVPEESQKWSDESIVLASIPVALKVDRPALESDSMFTPTKASLGLAWIAVALAALVTGIMLRSSIEFGDRRHRFASAVTHELRTPLTTFRMYSEMLADGMVVDPEQRAKYLDTLKKESSRLATLVENVLSYARLEDGRVEVTRAPVTVAQIVERVLPSLHRRADESGITLNSDIHESGDLRVVADVDVVGQILLNLVDNACKYAQDSGQPIDVTMQREGSAFFMRVRDHGPGVSVTAERKIFTPFERADHGQDPTPGIGLGLALSRGMARDLGGDLLYEKAKGGGASFTLRLIVV